MHTLPAASIPHVSGVCGAVPGQGQRASVLNLQHGPAEEVPRLPPARRPRRRAVQRAVVREGARCFGRTHSVRERVFEWVRFSCSISMLFDQRDVRSPFPQGEPPRDAAAAVRVRSPLGRSHDGAGALGSSASAPTHPPRHPVDHPSRRPADASRGCTRATQIVGTFVILVAAARFLSLLPPTVNERSSEEHGSLVRARARVIAVEALPRYAWGLYRWAVGS